MTIKLSYLDGLDEIGISSIHTKEIQKAMHVDRIHPKTRERFEKWIRNRFGYDVRLVRTNVCYILVDLGRHPSFSQKEFS